MQSNKPVIDRSTMRSSCFNMLSQSLPDSAWYVYILQCADNSLYTGITTDIQRRINEHNNSRKGAAYTRTRRPVTLVYFEQTSSRSYALKKEHAIKQLTREQKLLLIDSTTDSLQR